MLILCLLISKQHALPWLLGSSARVLSNCFASDSDYLSAAEGGLDREVLRKRISLLGFLDKW